MELEEIKTRKDWLQFCFEKKQEAVEKKALIRYIRDDDHNPIGAFVAYLRDKTPVYGWSLCHSKREKTFIRDQAIADAYRKAKPFDQKYIAKLIDVLNSREIDVSQVESAFVGVSKYFKIENPLQIKDVKYI